jgi:hypothetical protein
MVLFFLYSFLIVSVCLKQKEKTVADEGHISDDEITAYSRCSVPYLFTVFKSITCSDHRKGLVKKIGFQHMLDLDDCNVPRLFAQFIADNTKPDSEAIIIGEKSIPIDPKSFELVLGIPAGQLPVETDEEAGKLGFLSLFGLSEVPTVRFFGDKIIKQKDLPDDEFCRCFMAVVLATFLCPNSSAKPSTKYLGALIDVDEIRNRNWCKFAHVWLMWYIKKYQKERAKHNKSSMTLGGCIYQLTVSYSTTK